MNTTNAPRPKKHGPSQKDTQATLRDYLETDTLLTLEPRKNESAGHILRGSVGGVSVKTTVTAENLAQARKVEKRRKRIRKLALACLAIEQWIPENPAFPDGPTRPTGPLHRLLWEATPKTKQEQAALFQKITLHMRLFFRWCREEGLEVFRDSDALWIQLCDWVKAAKNGHQRARHVMQEIFEAVLWVGGGRPEELTEEERTAIVASYLKWYPIGKQLNKPFKRLWATADWQKAPKETQEAIREKLAKKFSLSVRKVEHVERYLKTSSRSGKATPSEATCALVAEEHDLGAGNVEKIYQDWLQEHPEDRMRRRKTPTTQAAERTPS